MDDYWEIARDNNNSDSNDYWETMNSASAPTKQSSSALYNFLLNHPDAAKVISKPAELLSPVTSKINQFVQGARLPSLAGGALQGLANTGISLGNIPLELLGQKKIPYPNLQQYLPQDLPSKAAFTAGDIGGSLPIAGGAYSALGKIAPEMTSISRLLGEVGKGTATGAAIGENMPGGRTGGAILGGVAAPLNALRPSKIADTISDYKDKIEKNYSDAYNDLFQRADEAGVSHVNIPDTDFSRILDKTQSHYHEALAKYLKDPTLINAHEAQSHLGDYIRDYKFKNLAGSQAKTYNQAVEAQKKIRDSIYSNLQQGSSPNLDNEYFNLTKGYRKEVVPYKDVNISKYQAGKLKGNKLIKRLLSNDEFMSQEADKYPELLAHELWNSKLGKAAIVAGAGGLGVGLGLKGSNSGNTYNNYYQP